MPRLIVPLDIELLENRHSLYSYLADTVAYFPKKKYTNSHLSWKRPSLSNILLLLLFFLFTVDILEMNNDFKDNLANHNLEI